MAPPAAPAAPPKPDFPEPAAGGPAPLSVVGRLCERWEAWAARGASAQVVEWVRGGFPITPRDQQALARAAVQGRMTWTAADSAWLDAEVARLAATGAVEAVAARPAVVSPLLLAPKAGPKKWRLVVDMRALNAALPHRAAKAEGLPDLLRLAGRGWWAVSWDLEAGYHHVDVAPASRSLLGFGWAGRWYRWRVLPFGLSLSPWAFTRVVRAAVAHWRAQGLRVWAYMDDFVLFAPTAAELLRHRAVLEGELDRLGLVRAPGKGVWTPTQRFIVLGMGVDLAAGQVFVPPDKAATVRQAVLRLARHERPTVREIASVAGRLTALHAGWSLARLVARPLLVAVAAALPPEASELWTWTADGSPADDRRWLLVAAVRAAYRQRVALAADAREVLGEAGALLAAPTELWRPAWTPPGVVHLYTDASTSGWGAVLAACGGRTTMGGPWPSSSAATTPGHINRLELTAVGLALDALAAPLRDQLVHLHVDSSVALAVLRKGSPVAHLHALALTVWRRAAALHMRLVGISWIASTANPADAPSRAWAQDEAEDSMPLLAGSAAPTGPLVRGMSSRLDDWGLHAACAVRLAELWGPFTVDAFATTDSALLRRFWARWPCAEAAAVDAFAQDWAAEFLLLVPPFRLLHRTLAQLAAHRARGVLIVPDWPGQPWWPRLLEVAVAWCPLAPTDFRLIDGYAEPLQRPEWRHWAVLADGGRARSAVWA